MLEPCPGCGALFPHSDGPVHRYIGASAGCWALFGALAAGYEPAAQLVSDSRVSRGVIPPASTIPTASWGSLMGDAYAVQHHGEDSAQAIQSVAAHVLVLHGAVARGVDASNRLWILGRALRRRGVFRKLGPPALGSALTLRHLLSGGGNEPVVTRADYVVSVYRAWTDVHLATIEAWYERYVVADELSSTGR